MGIRKSSAKPKGRVSGDGVAVRLPNNPTVRSVRRHIHCTSVYVCSPIAANRGRGDTKPRSAKKTKAPRERGFNMGH